MPLPSIHTADTTTRTLLNVGADGHVAVTIHPPASSRPDLNAHAKEFVPSFSPPPPPQSPQKLTATLLSTTSTGVQLVAYYDQQGRYLYTGPYDPYIAGLADYAAADYDATTLPAGVDQAYVDAALSMLADAFPLYSTEQLFATFAEQGYDVVTSSDLLLSLESGPAPRAKTLSASSRSRTVRAKRAPNLNLSSESDFPSLAGGPGPEEAKACRASTSSSDSITPPSVSTPDGSVKDLQLDAHCDGPVSVGMRCSSNGVALSLCVASEAADVPPDTPPRASAWGRCTPQPKASSFLAIARKAEHIAPPKPEPVIMPPPAIAPQTPTQTAPRVLTGAAVTRQYQDARSNARDLARLRNMCFMQATQAYLAGNKALAKELGARGRAYNDEMKAAHAAASSNIYRTRNAAAPQGFIDLHGLHVKEALEVLDRELPGNGARHAMQICVGTGSHTKGSRTPARLPAAVERYLNERHLSFSYSLPGLIELEPTH